MATSGIARTESLSSGLLVFVGVFVGVVLSSGCVGHITGGGPGDEISSGAGSGSISGTSTARATTGIAVTDLPLPRLSHDEYIQTITDLTQAMVPTAATQILATVMPLTADLPVDTLVTIPTEKHGGFARDDQSEQQEYSDTPVIVGAALAAAMTSSPDRIAALFGSCSNNGASVDMACLTAFVKSFGAIALRHPLSDDDVTFYTGTATSSHPTTADLANVITVMLASPRFLYRVESGGDKVSGNVYKLDAFELAARLSYHFWGTMPDDQLRADASSGALLTDAGYAAEVDRLMADARADATLRTFFEEWFWPLLEMPPLDSRVSDPVFKAFSGTDLPGPTLRTHMINEVLDATSWVTSHGGALGDLITNQLSFARDADLAAIYGVTPWDGQSAPQMLPPARVGLLTRAAFLATGTSDTRPIMKGVFIRTTFLCDTVPPPPPNAANTPIVEGPNQTTREEVESITEGAGTVCAGCHKPLINPLGFASESFDSLGRERIQQTFYDASGNVMGSKAVDTTSVPGVVAGDTTMSSGMGDVSRLIAASGKVEGCMAKRFFRFAFRRIETTADQPTIDALGSLVTSGKLVDLFKGVALRPEFRERMITP